MDRVYVSTFKHKSQGEKKIEKIYGEKSNNKSIKKMKSNCEFKIW